MFADITRVLALTYVAVTVAQKAEFNDWVKCGYMYKELGCEPNFTDGVDVCPTKYTCPSLDVSNPPKTCHVKGKTYQNGEPVPGFDDCGPSCSCYDGKVECDVIDCPDQEEDKTDCVSQYNGEGCCANIICDKNKINKLETCDVGGKLYREGEIVPSECDVICKCTKNFTGDMSSLECRKVDCKLEYYHKQELSMRAAPIFTESNSCCPVDWEWPTDNYNDDKHADKNKCYFGTSSIDVKSEFDLHKPGVLCSCIRPPFLTCILKSDSRH